MPDPILSGGAPQQRAGIITTDQEIEIGTWSSSLSWKDRQRLRAIVRKVHLAHIPQSQLTDTECDKLLDAWGPRTGEVVIKKALQRGFSL